jgi:hypothetical protein
MNDEQMDKLQDLFGNWIKTNSDLLDEVGCLTSELVDHDEICKFFLLQVAETINCDVSIMTTEERNANNNSMEGLD